MKVDSLSKRLFFLTARIETTRRNGDVCTGTGFFYSEALSGGDRAVLLITNRHVVANALQSVVTLIEADETAATVEPKLGATVKVVIGDGERHWMFPDDPEIDLAVVGFGDSLEQLREAGCAAFFKSVTPDLFPTPSEVAELSAIESVTFIGYPSGLYDLKHGTPIARRGWTATPVALDYEGKPAFLIDAPVFGGSSGSPVFVLNEGMYTTPEATRIGTRIMFLGVVTSVYWEPGLATIVAAEPPSVTYERLLNLGLVFRYDVVHDLIAKALALGTTTPASGPV